jgi:hypothetical protein
LPPFYPLFALLSQKFIHHVDTIVDTLGAIGLHLHKFGEMLSFSPFSFAFRAFGVLCEVSFVFVKWSLSSVQRLVRANAAGCLFFFPYT